jgi:long-subunit acyl-CoA synthetase (AMP-forming)
MKGYRNNPKANEEVFFQLNGNRYFRTGDLGRMVEGKFLKITGRIKEQFKLENGKFVVPAPVEDIFTRGPMILQAFLYGENKKFTVLLIVPNYVEIEKWMKDKQPELLPLLPKDPKNFMDLGKDPEENKRFEQLFQNPAFIGKVSREVSRVICS